MRRRQQSDAATVEELLRGTECDLALLIEVLELAASADRGLNGEASIAMAAMCGRHLRSLKRLRRELTPAVLNLVVSD